MAAETWTKLEGLLAATLTPMNADGSINYEVIPAYGEHLISNGLTQLYLNGTGSEHPSLSLCEREKLVEAWQSFGRMSTVIVHCGAGSLHGSQRLAAHAEAQGVKCIAVIMPTYFKATSIQAIVEYCAAVAESAPKTPFMYYHFPALTGINFRLADILRAMDGRIASLVGAKCTSTDLHDYGESLTLFDNKYDIVIGGETMLNSAIAMGATSSIGIAFNVIGKPCARIVDNMNKGDMKKALKDQYAVQRFCSSTHAGVIDEMIASYKYISTKVTGIAFGEPRLPILAIDKARGAKIEQSLQKMNFYEWIQ